MSDKNPLNKREKGLEDEWIRRHEREQREAARKGQADSGKPAQNDSDDEPQSDRRTPPGEGHIVLLWMLGLAAVGAVVYFLS